MSEDTDTTDELAPYFFNAEEYWGDGADLLEGKISAYGDKDAEARCRKVCEGYWNALGEEGPQCMSVRLYRGYDAYGQHIADIEI